MKYFAKDQDFFVVEDICLAVLVFVVLATTMQPHVYIHGFFLFFSLFI
jgi:hypothetical protein